jgi:hypothetical protein
VAFQLRRFVSSQKDEQTLLEFPPLQKGGSLNLKAVKLDRKMASPSEPEAPLHYTDDLRADFFAFVRLKVGHVRFWPKADMS